MKQKAAERLINVDDFFIFAGFAGDGEFYNYICLF